MYWFSSRLANILPQNHIYRRTHAHKTTFPCFVALFNVESYSIPRHAISFSFSLSLFLFFLLFSFFISLVKLAPDSMSVAGRVLHYKKNKASRSRKVVCVNWLWNCHALLCSALLCFTLTSFVLLYSPNKNPLNKIGLIHHHNRVHWWIAKMFSIWSSSFCLNSWPSFQWKEKLSKVRLLRSQMYWNILLT